MLPPDIQIRVVESDELLIQGFDPHPRMARQLRQLGIDHGGVFRARASPDRSVASSAHALETTLNSSSNAIPILSIAGR